MPSGPLPAKGPAASADYPNFHRCFRMAGYHADKTAC